ncbi:hypothetical protein X975_09401, partial [Stegodyphus mimosarum]
MTNISHYVHAGIELLLRLFLDPSLLQPAQGWCQRQLCIEGFMKVVCMRGSQPLMSRHRRDRLQWAQQHVHWTPDHWRAVLFMDESRFSLESDSRYYLIWREAGTHYHP